MIEIYFKLEKISASYNHCYDIHIFNSGLLARMDHLDKYNDDFEEVVNNYKD